MGGHKRKGQAQRTKNNMKPSNSGRIAELVDNRGFQFSTFSTLSESNLASSSSGTPSIPVLSFEMLGSNVDPNFNVVLKKINKKDATTRFKALQELKDLCKSSTPEVLKQVLPIWARIYCLLAIDVEHRVREAVQEVHQLIVNSVGRNLAPYLKQIAPLWLISQYDTYAPAASVASNAFQEVFSSHKMIEVISFCQAEILSYIKENILNLTPQSLSKGDLSKDEMEAKYERIIISSLNGYALYLSKVPSEQIEKFKIINIEIISSTKFWKFSKYKSPTVRAAWFTLLSSLCQHGTFLLANEKKQVANSVIGGIDDYDSAVLSVVWEAALHSFTHIQDFWLHVNLDKFFLPKFCNILKHGGHGNASYIYPNILLLMNSIPADVIKDKHQFFGMIFSSFREGMKQPLVVQSPTESDAVASAFIECIQFLIKLNIEDQVFCTFLLEQHLLKVLSTFMLQGVFHYQLKSFVRALSHMLMYWHKNKKSQVFYEALLHKFWTDVVSLSIDSFKNSTLDKEQLSAVLNCHFLMISIFNSPHAPSKKNLKVSFVEDSRVNKFNTESNSCKLMDSNKNPFEKNLKNDMLMFAKELFQCYYAFCLESENKHLQILVLSQMSKIIELLNVRLNSFILYLEPKWSSSVLIWLKDTDILMENLLGILFSSLEFLDLNDQSQLMSELTEERCKECLKDAIKLASHSENVKLKQWLQSEDMKTKICRMYDEINNESALETVKHFFDLNTNGEFIIGISTVLLLMEKIERQLSQSEFELKIGTEMVRTLFRNIASVQQARYEDLVLKMLESLFISIIQGYGNIVYTTWEKGIEYIATSKLNDNTLKEHVKKLSDHLTTYISDRYTHFDMKLIHLSIVKLVVILTKNNERKMSDFGVLCIEMFLSSVCSSSSVNESQKQIETVCLYGDIIYGKLYNDVCLKDCISSSIKEKWDPLLEINALGYVKSVDFVIKILSSVFGVEINEEENEDDSDNKSSSLPPVPYEIKIMFDKYIVHLACSLCLLNKFKNYYSSTKQYFEIKNYIEPFGRLLKEIVQRCDPIEQRKILESLTSNNQSVTNVFRCDAKELILEYLEGTLQEETNCSVILHNNADISGFVLEINEIRKLKRLAESKCISDFELNEKLNIITEKYRESFFSLNKTDYIGTARNFLLMTAEVAWLFQTVIAAHPTLMSVKAWDFVRISVAKWLSCISNTPHHSDNYIDVITLTTATCKLLITISNTLSNEESLGNYCEEWRDVFAIDAYHSLCKSWKNITETALNQGVNCMIYLHIIQLSETISCLCEMETFHKLKPANGNVKEWVDFTMTCILTPSVPVQLTSYKILRILIPNLTKLDESLNETSLDKISCNMLEPKLIETQTVFMTMLQDFSIGVSCSVAPFTDSYTYSLAYLLLWSVLIRMCKEGDSQQKYIYPLWIKEKGIIANFIEGVVKLMPESLIHFQEKNAIKGQDFFLTSPSHTFYDWTSEKLSHLSCWLLTELMATLPAVVRQWASEADPKQLSFVDRLVTAFISPNLASREMSAISKQQKTFDNMKVYTHPSVREVVAVYTVEESSTELVVQLANNHPLSPPKVDISKAMISSIQTRQWLKQLTIFLTHQNGSIWDGLVLWKSNLDKKFEGIDECYICFSILHNTTHQLPKLSCHTCKKKFHSYCLYKWFSTSHKSTCPICRAIF